MKKVQELKLKALRSELKYRRNYPKGQLAAHVVGYVNKEMVPSVGIEKSLDGFLQGQKGWIESERDGRRREIASNRLREVAPIDGSTVVLTINSLVQNACEVALEKAAQEYTPKSGIIIVSEPKTGRILGLANWPTFDLNKFFDPKLAPMDSQRNRAVSDIYEPGSVFKIVSVSGALEERLITPQFGLRLRASVRAVQRPDGFLARGFARPRRRRCPANRPRILQPRDGADRHALRGAPR